MRARPDRGSAAVLATVLAAVLTTTALAGAALGGLLVAERRVAAAADLAALAAASALQRGEPACPSARAVALANTATLTACAVRGDVVEVRARVRVSSLLRQVVAVSARSRAGPSSP